MDLIIENIPKSFSFEKLSDCVSAYSTKFTLEIQTETPSSWDAFLSIPHKISPLMIIDLLGSVPKD